MSPMLRYLTASESHGQALIATMEGIPAHVRVGVPEIAENLRRRRLGVGRGARMKSSRPTRWHASRDSATARRLVGPDAVQVGNTEGLQGRQVMESGEVDADELARQARNAPLTRALPRPGHADLAGMQKYDFDEARPIVEAPPPARRPRASRWASSRRPSWEQALGVTLLGHVVELGPVRATRAGLPTIEDLPAIDEDPVRCFDAEASAARCS